MASASSSVRRGSRVVGGMLAGFLFVLGAVAFLSDSGITAVWWTSFAVGWLVVSRADLSTQRRYDIVMGSALLGSIFVILGAWMEWPAFSPLYDGPIPAVYISGTIESGYQHLDLLMVAVAIVGGVSVTRYQRRMLATPVALGTGIICFSLAVGTTYLTTAGPFVLTWGYYVTLGGSFLFLFSGLIRANGENTQVS